MIEAKQRKGSISLVVKELSLKKKKKGHIYFNMYLMFA